MGLFDEIISSVYEPNEYPALEALTQEWSQTLPFAGLRILAATPIFRNTMVQYRALIAGGAVLTVGRAVISNEKSATSMPCDEGIVRKLQELDVPVVTPEEVLAEEADGEFYDLVLDCAGQFSKCHPRYGFVELTRSGVQFYEESESPVYVADSGIVKRIETCLGTGDGYFRALEQLNLYTLMPFRNEMADGSAKKLLVFGSGKVGCGIVLQGLIRGFEVDVVTDTKRAARGSSFDCMNVILANDVAVIDCNDERRVCEKILNADFIVTATGVKNALAKPALTDALMKASAVLANMGVEDEYGDVIPTDRVLNQKKSLNFMLEEPTHLKYIDASLALHAALGEMLIKEEFRKGIKNPPAELEQRLLMTTIQNGVIGGEVCEMLGINPQF